MNLNELDQQMEAIKEMFVKKQEMMKKMSTAQVQLVFPANENFWKKIENFRSYFKTFSRNFAFFLEFELSEKCEISRKLIAQKNL